jgi:DNA polymerase III delta prime subunit
MLKEHFDKENPHHAYLIEGNREDILPQVLEFAEILGLQKNSPDLCHILMDNFKIDDAFALKKMSGEMSTIDGKKVFIVSANQFSPDAQNTMLKMFEEPIFNTHFFMIVPDIDALFKTLISRFYVIKNEGNNEIEIKLAEKFIAMPMQLRINYIKEFLVEPEDEIVEDSIRSKALKFLNMLELVLHKKVSTKLFNKNTTVAFEQIFKARKFIRQPGSASKTLLESVALSIPEKI